VVALSTIILVLIAACGGKSAPPPSDVVSSIPWKGDEKLTYNVIDKKGERLGTQTLTVDVEGAKTTLTQAFSSDSNQDTSAVVVDSKTLKPISATREIVTPKDTENIEVTYTDQGALIKQGERQSGLSVPEHAYDNDTSLFLWRTIDFHEGYRQSYVTIITNRRSRQTVTLEVTGKETVKVPAGEFLAWRVEVKAANAKQIAWFADTALHPLVRYDNDRGLYFELQAAPSSIPVD
jgi:hypothetical protein